MRWRRRVVILALTLAAIGWAAGRYVLPGVLASAVARRLEAAAGAPVRVDAVDVGFGSTSLRGVRIYEAGATPADAPLVEVPSVRTDISVRGLLTGRTTPRDVTLDDATVLLRFDRDGRLLTRLPAGGGGGGGALPVVRVRRGRVTVRQDGRDDLTLRGVTAEVRADAAGVILAGSVDDPQWGTWAVTGEQNRGTGAVVATMKSDRVSVTTAGLTTLPLVPPDVWQQVRPNGETAADCTLRSDPAIPGVGLRLAFEPRGMTVSLPPLGLTADRTRGSVVYEGGVVHLRGVSAGVAGGTVGADGELDLRSATPAIRLALTAADVDVRRLPAGWGIPARLVGRIDGRADVQVTRPGGRVRVAGTGTGSVRGVPIGGQSATVALALRDEAVGPDAPAGTPPACCLVAETAVADADVGRLARELDITPPSPVEGRFALRVRLALPLDTLDDPRTFRAGGTADSPRVTCGGVAAEGVRARVAYAGGVVRLEEFRGTIPGPDAEAAGRFHIAGDVGVVPPGDLRGRLTVDAVPLARLLPLIPGNPLRLEGVVAAAVDIRAAVARLDRADAWEARGTVTADRVRAPGRAAGRVHAALGLAKGVLSVTDADGRLDGATVAGRGEVGLTAPWRFRVAVGLSADLAVLRRMAPAAGADPAVAGVGTVTAALAGTADPLAFEGSGKVTGSDVSVSGVRAHRLSFRWDGDANRINLRDVDAEVFGGRVTGGAVVPLRATEAGRLDLDVRDVDVPTLAAAIPGNVVRPPGRLAGTVRVTATAAPPGGARAYAATFGLRAPAVDVGGEVDYRPGAFSYRVDGEALGGRIHVAGRTPPTSAGADPPADGVLHLEGVELGRVWELLGVRTALGPLAGSGNVLLRFRHDGANFLPVGHGAVVLRRLRWGAADISPEVKAVLRLTASGLDLADVTGGVAGGELRGKVSLDWDDFAASRLALSVRGVEASRLLVPWPDLAAHVRGPVDAHVRVTPGAEWRADGRLTLRRGAVGGVEVADWHLPVDAAYTPRLGQGRVDVRETTAQVALGRVVGRAAYRWGAEAGSGQLEGGVRFSGVSLRHVLPVQAAKERVADGLLNGRLEVRGSDVKSLEDVTASFDGTLQQNQALGFPVLRELVPFIQPGGSETTVFDTGECRARLARGVVRVEQLSLVGPTVRLTVEGTVGPEGRLGLDAAVHTGRLGANPDAPVAVRLLRLRVGGTATRPAVGVTP